MKQMFLIGYCIIFFVFPVLFNLPLLAENIDDKVQDYATEMRGIVQQPQDYATEMRGIVQQPQDYATEMRGIVQYLQDAVLQVRNTATIVHVVDGDTIKVSYDGKNESVKLIGIDAPENKLSRKAKSEAIASKENLVTIISKGIDAANFMKNLLKKGDIVNIEFDIDTRDVNGDLLGYVFLSDGRMINEEIVRAGHAYVVTTSRNIKYQKRLLKAYAEAKAHKRGLWEQ
jgi:micrococcal nuclease